MSTGWKLRFEGSTTVLELPTAQRIVEGLREGEWEPTDDVQGPGERHWTTLEEHPQFMEVVAELEPPTIEEHDDTHLDMNPLIDVALVLLIFFILTTSYSALRRTIEVPAEQQSKDAGATQQITKDDVQDRTFKVEAVIFEERTRIRVGDKLIEIEDLESELKEIVRNTGRNQMLLEIDGKISWKIWAKIQDAAKASDITQTFIKRKKPG